MMNRRSAHSSEYDTLQYFEAAHRGGRSSGGGGQPPAFTRTASSTSLRGGNSRGYNPAALFSVAAMATAPVGTTVIEDDEEGEEGLDEDMVMLTELSSSSAKKDLDQDFDLCEQCTRRRRRARMLQQSDTATDGSEDSSSRQPSKSDGSHDNATVTMPSYRRSDYGEEHGSGGERGERAEGESTSTASGSPSLTHHNSQGQQQQQQPQKIPPPRPPRSKVPPVPVSSTNCLKSKSLSDTITGSSLATASTGLTMDSVASEKAVSASAASTAVFTITPNPISLGAPTAATAAVSTTEVTLTSASEDAISVKKLPDYCQPAEDTLGMTPAELALIQKRIQLRRILPCIRFEDLESERGVDESRSLEMVDKRLADVHRDVMRRTENRYLVMEAATFGDKLFTGTLIILTILGILVLFWFRNFGPGLHMMHEVESDRL